MCVPFANSERASINRYKDLLVAGRVHVRKLEPAFNIIVESIEEFIQLLDGFLDSSNSPQKRYPPFPNGSIG